MTRFPTHLISFAGKNGISNRKSSSQFTGRTRFLEKSPDSPLILNNPHPGFFETSTEIAHADLVQSRCMHSHYFQKRKIGQACVCLWCGWFDSRFPRIQKDSVVRLASGGSAVFKQGESVRVGTLPTVCFSALNPAPFCILRVRECN